jgi:hypothetical protein
LDEALGILLLIVYIVAILSLSAAITFAVVKLFPTERTPKKPDSPDASSGGDAPTGGRLFRKAKRSAA